MYNCVYTLTGGNFNGNGTPTGAGSVTTTNRNGDPCDRYFNIMLDPRLVSPYTGDYNLRDDSPCIDAGDTTLLDPDATIRDQGAFYFFQCPVFIELTSHSSCIIIPAGGGSFSYDAEVTSNYPEPYSFDAWVDIILPNGNTYGPVMSRSGLVIPVGGAITRTLTQYIPSSCPSGFLYLVGKVGFLPDSVVDSDEVPFMKLTDDGSAPNHNQGWSVYGWDNEVSTVSEYGLLSAYPNPFNPETRLTYTLSESGSVSLVIYDVRGKEVARLAQGWHPAGSHQVVFDAGGLSSGVYFARLQAKGLNQTQKLLLVK